jgi:hypothetical protein
VAAPSAAWAYAGEMNMEFRICEGWLGSRAARPVAMVRPLSSLDVACN